MGTFRYMVYIFCLYALFAINQAVDDYHGWSQCARNWFLVLGIIGAIIVFVAGSEEEEDEEEDEEEYEDEDEYNSEEDTLG